MDEVHEFHAADSADLRPQISEIVLHQELIMTIVCLGAWQIGLLNWIISETSHSHTLDFLVAGRPPKRPAMGDACQQYRHHNKLSPLDYYISKRKLHSHFRFQNMKQQLSDVMTMDFFIRFLHLPSDPGAGVPAYHGLLFTPSL